LRAFTSVSDRLLPDPERHFAPLAANALGIPIDFFSGDDFSPFDRGTFPAMPEPIHNPFASLQHAQLAAVALRTRVAFTGNGGDPAFSSSLSAHFAGLFRRRRFGRILRDLAHYFSAEGRFSRLYPATRFRILSGRIRQPDLFPSWLNPEFAARLDLPARWEEVKRPVAPPLRAPRPTAYENLRSVIWAQMFETLDPGVTRLPLEFRHPFFDLRVLSFLLRLPALPWCSDKELLRLSLRGVLPDAIRLRPKTPLVADPLVVALRHDASRWTSRLIPSGPLEPFVQVDRVPEVADEIDSNRAWMHLRPLSLQGWLQHVHDAPLETPTAQPRAAAFRAG
jgi:asparagine synthase (glutamine-hydrolysing)